MEEKKNRTSSEDVLKKVMLDDLLRYRECPQKYIITISAGIRSKNDSVNTTFRRHLMLVVRDALTDSLSNHASYVAALDREITLLLGQEDSGVKRHHSKAMKMFATFLNRYVYADRSILSGASVPVGLTEYGVRVVSSADFIFVSSKTGESVYVVSDMSDGTHSDKIGTPFLRAALIKEHFLQEYGNIRLVIHNLIKDSVIEYNNDNLHDNMIRTIRYMLKHYSVMEQYHNVGPWCSYCHCINNCYDTVIRR